MTDTEDEKWVSCDGHVMEPEEALPSGVRYEGEGWLLVPGEGYECPPLPVGPAVCAGDVGRLLTMKLGEQPGAWDADTRRGVQEEAGVAAEILYPTLAMTLVETARGDEAGNEAARCYNEWVAEEFKGKPGMYPVVVASGVVKDLTAFACQALNSAGLLLPMRLAINEIPEEVWEIAAYDNIVLHWHAFSRPTPASFSRHPLAAAWEGFRPAQDRLVELILSGVFERHPKLKVVFAEMDVGWLGHTARRLQNYCERFRRVLGLEGDFNVWKVLENNVAFAVNRVDDAWRGSKDCPDANIMWGWDWPHVDATLGPKAMAKDRYSWGWYQGTFAYLKTLENSNEVVKRWFPRMAREVGLV